MFNDIKKNFISLICEQTPPNQPTQTKIKSLSFFVATSPQESINVIYEPSLCMVLQGSKIVDLQDCNYKYNPQTYLLSSTHIPAKISINQASLQQPFISFKLTFSLEEIYEVWKEMDKDGCKKNHQPQKGLFFGEVHYDLLESIFRLAQLLKKTQEHRELFSPLLKKEVLYQLFCSESRDFLKQYALEGSTTNQIAKVILEIKNNFNQPLKIKDLARKVSMSESSLHHNFKKITNLSPLQFQKKLRLEEARQMLLKQNIDANQVALSVGYNSSSQFNREYKQMFGFPPKMHTRVALF